MPVARKLWQLIFVCDAGGDGAALDHHVDVGLGQRLAAGELAVPHGGEEGSGRLAGQAGSGQPFIQELLEVVVAGELVDLAAFFVQPHPAAALLDVVVFDLHCDGGADAGEGVAHERDERAIAEADEQRVAVVS